MTTSSGAVDVAALDRAVRAQAARPTPGVADMAAYLDRQNGDASHREVLGPLVDGGGPSGVVVHRGATVATWGDPTRPEMAFSATKSVLSLVAGLAHDDGLLGLDRPVQDDLGSRALAELADEPWRRITWRHLLTQTSGWRGVLWGRPTDVDAQAARDPVGASDAGPGEGWAYNDVRVNLLALALTVLVGRSLPDLLRERVADPLGCSGEWSWHGYRDAVVDGIPVVSGGAHWGGGLVIGAADLARLGELYRRGGAGLVSRAWVEASWRPCAVKPDYGLSWWRNDARRVFPAAPPTGRAARGNLGRHLCWVDPARDLVVVSRWGEDVERLLVEVSAAVGLSS